MDPRFTIRKHLTKIGNAEIQVNPELVPADFEFSKQTSRFKKVVIYFNQDTTQFVHYTPSDQLATFQDSCRYMKEKIEEFLTERFERMPAYKLSHIGRKPFFKGEAWVFTHWGHIKLYCVNVDPN